MSAELLSINSSSPLVGALIGLLVHRLASSNCDLALSLLLGAAGGLVGGSIAPPTLGAYSNLIGAALGAIFFVLGWQQRSK